MSETCKHQREKLLGIPQTGACYHCAPWMFLPREKAKADMAALKARRLSREPLPMPSRAEMEEARPELPMTDYRHRWQEVSRRLAAG